MKEIIGVVAVTLGFIAYIPYIRDIFVDKARPHPYSWLIWGATAALIFLLQITHGGGAGSWTTASIAVVSFLIAILALKKGARRTIHASDKLALVAAMSALVLWMFAKQPLLAMLLLICVDVVGLIPSIRKTYIDPESETLSMWMINGMRHGMSIFALTDYTLLTLANPLVWVFANFGFCIMVLVRRRGLHR